MATLIINEKKKLGRIEPEVYGHFSEHLGRCIYEGLYVGEDSDIENVNGMRTDERHYSGNERVGRVHDIRWSISYGGSPWKERS